MACCLVFRLLDYNYITTVDTLDAIDSITTLYVVRHIVGVDERVNGPTDHVVCL